MMVELSCRKCNRTKYEDYDRLVARNGTELKDPVCCSCFDNAVKEALLADLVPPKVTRNPKYVLSANPLQAARKALDWSSRYMDWLLFGGKPEVKRDTADDMKLRHPLPMYPPKPPPPKYVKPFEPNYSGPNANFDKLSDVLARLETRHERIESIPVKEPTVRKFDWIDFKAYYKLGESDFEADKRYQEMRKRVANSHGPIFGFDPAAGDSYMGRAMVGHTRACPCRECVGGRKLEVERVLHYTRHLLVLRGLGGPIFAVDREWELFKAEVIALLGEDDINDPDS